MVIVAVIVAAALVPRGTVVVEEVPVDVAIEVARAPEITAEPVLVAEVLLFFTVVVVGMPIKVPERVGIRVDPLSIVSDMIIELLMDAFTRTMLVDINVGELVGMNANLLAGAMPAFDFAMSEVLE